MDFRARHFGHRSVLEEAQRILDAPKPHERPAVELMDWTTERRRKLPGEVRREHIQGELLLLQKRFFTLLRRATLAQRQPLLTAYEQCFTQWEEALADVDLPTPYLVVSSPTTPTEPEDPGVLLAMEDTP